MWDITASEAEEDEFLSSNTVKNYILLHQILMSTYIQGSTNSALNNITKLYNKLKRDLLYQKHSCIME